MEVLVRLVREKILGAGTSFYVKCSQYLFRLDIKTAQENVRIRSFSGPYFPAFGLNTEIYRVNLYIQSECGKIRTRKTPNIDTFYEV